jgi:hypothetical protein
MREHLTERVDILQSRARGGTPRRGVSNSSSLLDRAYLGKWQARGGSLTHPAKLQVWIGLKK